MLSPKDEALLEQLLEGARSPEDPIVRKALQDSPELCAEWEALSSVQEGLSEIAQALPPGMEDRVRRSAEGLPLPGEEPLAPGPGLGTPPKSVAPWLLAAAGLLLALGLWWMKQPSEPGDALLGAGTGIEITVREPDDSTLLVEWKAELPPGGWYEVRLSWEGRDQPLRSGELSESSWVLSIEEWNLAPPLLVEVIVFGASGAEFESGSWSSSR